MIKQKIKKKIIFMDLPEFVIDTSFSKCIPETAKA